jgi:replicative DNA helicase
MLGLVHGLPRLVSIAGYINYVRDASQIRRLIKATSKITSEALEAEEDAEVLIDRAEAEIFSLRDTHSPEAALRIGQLADQRLEAVQARQENGKHVNGNLYGL